MNHSLPQSSPEKDAIEAMAASWLAQREEGFAAEQAAAFARWQHADARHAAAVARLEKTCSLLENMPLLRSDRRFRRELAAVSRGKRQNVVRFPALRAVAAIAAAVAVMFGFWWLQSSSAADTFTQSYATTAEGYQRVTLPDGSVVELNASSETRVQFTQHERRVALVSGEAHFTVAKNKARPFVVSAGKVSVRAVGTAFNVRLEKAAVEVLVTEGKVQVQQAPANGNLPAASASDPEPSVLVAGQRAVIPTDVSLVHPQVEQVQPVTIRETLAWQAPRLVFVDTPLADVVEQFNRRNRLQLIVGDAELGHRPVGGNFRADNVEVFVRLLESSRDIRIEARDAEHLVLRKAK